MTAPVEENQFVPAPATVRGGASAKAPTRPASFGLGLLGGFIGALVGVVVYFLIFKYTGYRLKLLAIGVGALAGWFADFLGRAEGSKELGVITATFALMGLIGAQYFVALGWWHEIRAEEFKLAEAAFTLAVSEAKEAVKSVSTGSDVEIRLYLAAKEKNSSPAEISEEQVREFRDATLPEYRTLASGQLSKEQFMQQHELKNSMTSDEQKEDDNTFKGVFLLLFLSKINLFALAAAAGLAFKLSTNA